MFPALRTRVPVLAARRRIRRRARRAVVPDPLTTIIVIIVRRLRLCLVQHQSRLARQRRRRQGRRRRVARHLRARHRRRERQRRVRVPALQVGGGDRRERGGGEEHARAVWRGGRGGAFAVCAQGGHRWQRQGGHGEEGGARPDGRGLEGRGGALHEEGLSARCCFCGLRVEERCRAAAAESVQRLLLHLSLLRLLSLLLLLSLSSNLLLLRLVLHLYLRCRRPALELQRGDGLLEARRDDRRRARRVKVLHRVLQALPLQALCDERRDMLAPRLVAGPALALLALRRHRRRRRRRSCCRRRWRGARSDIVTTRNGLDGLILVRRAERVLGEAALVLGQGALRLRLPDLALLEAEVVPHHANDLGQRAVVALDAGRHVLRLDEGRAEEDECVGRARDVLRRDAPVVFCVFGRGGGGFATPLRCGLVDRGGGGGEEGRGGRVRVGEECGL